MAFENIPLIAAGFILVTILYFSLFVFELAQASRKAFDSQKSKRIIARTVIVLFLWAGFVCAWSLSGKMGDFSLFPFNITPTILIPLIGITAISATRTFQEIASNIPQHRIILLQSFRIFVEVLLWGLFLRGLAPVQMTFEGSNFDVLTGLTALLVGYLISRNNISQRGVIIWNVAGLLLLLNIVTIAILSMPSPFRTFHNAPANIIVAEFPISLLPALLVPLAYLLHLTSLRAKKP